LAGDVLYRVNAGGVPLDAVPAWEGDTGGTPSVYLAGGSSLIETHSVSSPIDLSDPSVPAGTPPALFQTERWDDAGGSELTWQFPVDPGVYQVRLYFAEIYEGTMAPGARVFDVSIEGQRVLDHYDVYADVGGLTGVVKSFDVTSDTLLEITLAHGVENPAIKAIEILRGGRADALGASAPSIDFGDVPVGGRAMVPLGLTNLGSSGDPSIEIDPSQATISGPGTSGYDVAFSGPGPITLAPGETTTVDVTFSPEGSELASATLAIAHSGSGAPLLLPLTGHGIAGTAAALIKIDPGETLDTSSTFTTGSFSITNLATDGPAIESVRFDLSTAILPDQVFDLDGAAGDPVGKDFTPDRGAEVTGLASHTFFGPHDGGFDVLEIFFADFQPGESFSFSVDVDPTSIQGAPQPGPEVAGKVSGLELTGSTLTVAFSDGSVLTGQPFRIPGSLTGSQAILRTTAPAAATLEVVGAAALPTTVTAAEQTIRVRGPVGAAATLLIAEAALLLETVPGGGFDIDPFEANKIIRVDQQSGTVGANGYVDFPLLLERSHPNGGIYALSAVLVAADGQTGPMASAVLAYDPAPSAGDGSVLYRVNAGGSAIAGVPAWEADTSGSPAPYLSAGSSATETASTSGPIDLSDPSIPVGTPAAIFQSERWDAAGGSEMQWDFPVPAGPYEVRLYFAETYDGTMAAGARVFDVSIEGSLVLDDYDIFADVGGMAGVVKHFLVTSDTNLDIDLAHVTENPAIKAIEIVSAAGADQLGSSDDHIAFGAARIGGSVSRTIELRNAGSAGDPEIVIDRAAMAISGAAASAFDAEIHAHEVDHGAGADPTSPITLGPGESVPLTVTFTPTSDATASAVVQIPHSGTASPLTIPLSGTGVIDLPIGFGKATLANTRSSLPTSLQFGPDGRLYVAQQDGLIQIYDVVRNGPNDYTVSATESITAIQTIPNHDDDGSLNTNLNTRLVTGLLVTGTARHPVVYVGSSDPRIGAGPSGTDLNLDTNSGVLSRLTYNGVSWDKLDLVRGLPRSEENHATNGLQLDPATNTLYVAQGSNTNMGAVSNNFGFLPEFALSAAVLSIDLDAIGETTYDLPTLDDEDRPGSSDAADPFGGNNGKNQAILVPGGPVQVYAPGFRNPYDVVLTENGRLYTIDNGPNAGWGDVPLHEGPQGLATNDAHEPGQTYGDGLHLITGPGYYGGHPNPTRSNPANTFNASNPQSPVSAPHPIESDYRIPGVQDGALIVYGASTNGLVEYTASNFQGSLQGDLLAASFDNTIKRIKLNSAGDTVMLDENLFHSVGSVPLDVTAVGDSGPFPGTIWVADLVGNAIVVFEPNDYDGGSPAGGQEDDTDGDGYTNADELANGTNPNSAADVPPDWDGDFLSNLLDPDDDNDSLPDTADPFAIDPDNGTSTPIGVRYTWENDAPSPGGLLGLGFTGLMTNGTSDYESLFDPSALTAGGAAGVLTLDTLGGGDATGSLNTQRQAFQFGVDASNASAPFTARTRILAPFAGVDPTAPQSMGLFLGTGDQDNYVKIVITASGAQRGIATAAEIAGVVTAGPVEAVGLPGPEAIDLFLTVDPDLATVQASYALVSGETVGPRTNVGQPQPIPAGWLRGSMGLAVGILSTSDPTAPPVAATWDFLLVDTETGNRAPRLASIPDPVLIENESLDVQITSTDPDGDARRLTVASLPTFAQWTDHGDGTATLSLNPKAGDAGTYSIPVTATDTGTPTLADTQRIVVTIRSPILYRVNVGGPALATTPIWQADTAASPSPYLVSNPLASEFFFTGAAIDTSSPTIPTGTPATVFQTERWDPTGGGNMQWEFPVAPAAYEVRLYFAEIYGGAQAVGARTFDVRIEGAMVLDSYDIFADVGGEAGVVRSFVTISDSVLDIDFGHDVENPALKGIEIVLATAAHANTPPTLNPLADQTLIEGTTRQLNVAAQDADGDQLAFTASGLPSFATLNDRGDGTAVLSVSPDVGDAGDYPITVTVTDDGSPNRLASQSLLIMVTAPPAGGAVVYRINAGGPSLAGSPPWESDVADFSPSPETGVITIGSQLELFVDDFLIESMVGANLQLHPAQPVPASGSPFGRGAYPSILYDGTHYQHYYRDNQAGVDPTVGPPFPDGSNNEVTRYETSLDGINWEPPALGLFQVDVAGPNNVILADDAPAMHNFSPFLDTNPHADPQYPYKALAGLTHADGSPVSPSGLRAYRSADGVHWSLLSADPVITLADLPGGDDTFAFDSSVSVFWSEVEGKYVAYYRTWTGGSPGVSGSLRAISRAVSDDFLHWTDHVDVNANLPDEHLYTSTVKPYFRAPQIYMAFPTRFLPGQTQNNTQILLMTSRDGTSFDRTFGQQTFMPGIPGNRQNYAASSMIQTGPDELSLYSQAGIRYTMRLDGFASIDTSLGAGEVITRPVTFAGDELVINFTTAGTGSVRVEILDQQGQPIPGFTLADSDPMSGDAIARTVSWQGNASLDPLAGEAIRLRFVMEDADVYALRFTGPSSLSLPRSLSGAAGEVVSVPVRIDMAEPGGLPLLSVEVAIGFDPSRFTVAGARSGSLAPGFTVTTAVDYEAGTVLLTATGNRVDLPPGTFGDVVVLDLAVNSGAVLGPSPINLLSEINGVPTGINGGATPLSPAPTDDPGDRIDSSVSVLGALFDADNAPSKTFGVTTEINLLHPSIPAGTPLELFQTERFGTDPAQPLQWHLPVPPGDYEVRLYFAEIYDGITAPGDRVFDARIEDQLLLENYDVLADVGPLAGVVKSFVVSSDDHLDIDLIPVVENPAIKAIEILQVHGVPNYAHALDADGDDRVTPLDALRGIDDLNRADRASLAAQPTGRMPSLRTTIFGGDDVVPNNPLRAARDLLFGGSLAAWRSSTRALADEAVVEELAIDVAPAWRLG